MSGRVYVKNVHHKKKPRRKTGRGNAPIYKAPGALGYRPGVPLRGGTELKSVDTFFTSTQVGSGSAIVLINMPLENAAMWGRVARRVRAKSLQICGHIRPSNVNEAAVPQQLCRLMIIYDRQPNGATPAIADILLNYSPTGTTQTWAGAGLNMDQRDRFVVLRDRRLTLPAVGTGGGQQSPIGPETYAELNNGKEGLTYTEFIKLKGMETHFRASAGGIGDIATGAYWLVAITEEDSNAHSAYVLNWNARFKYFD